MRAPAPFSVGGAQEPLPLFVYGTLLPGQPLAGSIARHVVTAQPATVEGRLHWHRCRQFPVVVATAGARTWGLRTEVELDGRLLALLATEELACGYEGRWLETFDGDGTPIGAALTFTWPWRADTLGPEIAGGRFTSAEVLAAGYAGRADS